MNTIVLAYSGGFASSNAIHWMAETREAEVVTVTLDVGQGDDLGAIRARALSCGATRAHAIDARDELVREFLLPSLARGPLDEGPLIGEFTRPLIARKLLEVARIEGASVVAHASRDESIDAALRAIDPRLTILAPAREWQIDGIELDAFARARGISPRRPSDPDCRIEQSLWGRMISFHDVHGRPEGTHREASVKPTGSARLAIRFEGGIPVAINDVPMPPVDLVESVALIAGRYGVGRLESTRNGRTVVYDAPAAMVLHTARAALIERTGVVHLSVLNGGCTVLDLNTEVGNLA
jgi:argininosuccinate synthase